MGDRRKRVCILIPSHWAAKAGGAELQVRALVQRLATLDEFDVHFVARNVAPGYVPEGYELHSVPSRRIVAGTFLLEVPALRNVLRKIRPDVIYQRVACAYSGVAAHYARANSCRMVWHVSSDRDLTIVPWQPSWRSPIEQLSRRLVSYAAWNADTVVVQTQQQAQALANNHGRSDAVCIPNFQVAPTELAPKPQARVTVCWISNLKELKQPGLFVRLAADLRHRTDVEFVMVGAPQMRAAAAWDELKAMMARTPNLTYAGQLPKAEVETLLARSHVLVNSSQYEGFPNTFIEAWLRNVPVVSLNVNPDGVFDEGRYGVCAEGSYERMRTGVERLIDDAGLRAQTGARAQVFATERFSVRNIDRLIDVLAQDAQSVHRAQADLQT